MSDTVLETAGSRSASARSSPATTSRLDVEAGEVHALIGPNGAGKTTLIGQIAGELAPDRGRIRSTARDITGLATAARARLGLARSFQITSIFPSFTAPRQRRARGPGDPGHSFRFWRPADATRALRTRARGARASSAWRARATSPPAWRMASSASSRWPWRSPREPRLLLLDEPMAGHGHRGIAAHDGAAGAPQGAQYDPSHRARHGRRVPLADRISVLVNGSVIASGTPDEIRATPEVRVAYLGEDESRRRLRRSRGSRPATARARCCSACRFEVAAARS